MNKTTAIIIAIIIVILGLFTVFWLTKIGPITEQYPIPERPNVNYPTDGATPGGQTPVTIPPVPSPSAATFNIPTPEGDIEVNNFYKNAIEITPQNDAVATSTNDYRIFYDNRGKLFIITLLTTPLANAKDKAEQAFLKILNISPEKTCSLNVTVGTVMWVDPSYAGKELGLSFCQIKKF